LFNPDLRLLQRFREPLVFIVGADHPLAEKESMTLDEVPKVRGPLLMVKWGYSTYEFESFFQTGPIVDLPIETVRHMLLRSVGGAFLTRALVADELAVGRLVEVAVEGLPTSYRESVLVCLKSGTMSAALDNFVAVLREEADEFVIKERGCENWFVGS
jgi:DNA-binding transcriptional LysR family regulator